MADADIGRILRQAKTIAVVGASQKSWRDSNSIMRYLMQHERQVVSRESLARDVWKEQARTGPLDNVIDVHIARLRRKIDAEQSVKLIHTVRGVGFVLREGEP